MEDICSKCAHQKVCMFEMKYHGVMKAVEDAFSVCDNPLGSASPFTIKGINCRHYLEKKETPKDGDYVIRHPEHICEWGTASAMPLPPIIS